MFVTVDDRWLMWFANQSKLPNSAGDGTASLPEPDGTDSFFSQVSPIRGSDILKYFLFQKRPSRISLLFFTRYSLL